MRNTQQTIPFLVNYATPRSSAPQIGGYYSDDEHVWIDDKTKRPMIDFANVAELATKTKVKSEEDDESPFLLEMMTKTEVKAESDDHAIQANHLCELMTKTNIELESDDNGFDL